MSFQNIIDYANLKRISNGYLLIIKHRPILGDNPIFSNFEDFLLILSKIWLHIKNIFSHMYIREALIQKKREKNVTLSTLGDPPP